MSVLPIEIPRRIDAAIALYRQGEFALALASVDDLLGGEAANIDALNLAAACALALGRPGEAEQRWREVLRRQPGHAASWNNLGILLQGAGREDQARDAYRQALALQADYPDARANLGTLLHGQADALQRQGRRAEAEACYRAALDLKPDHAELHNNLAVLYAGAARADLAETHYRQALRLRPGYPEAWHNLGLLYTAARRLPDAESALREYVALRPHDPEGLNSLGNVCQYLHRPREAEAIYRRALALGPDNARTLNNLGALMQREGRAQDAEACYRHAIAADPEYPEARWNLGFLLLARGRLDEGWPWMEARYDARLARPIAARPRFAFACPQWQGEPLAGRSIVVWPEQGFGDTIQFVRYLPLLRAAGAGSVTLVCQDALLPLLGAVDGADRVLGLGQAAQLPPHDCWVFLLSLPMHAHISLATIPAALPYLAPDPERVAAWRARLAQAGAGLRVGLVWRGFGGHVNDANRSLPGLACLAPLLGLPGVKFFSLQRGMEADAGAGETLPPQLADLGPDIADFGDTAAIVAGLDLVICVDTAVAHVAGALGKPCWVLLPAVHPDWRWMEERTDSPWYPGALRLYRQARPGDWDGVVGQLAADLGAWPD